MANIKISELNPLVTIQDADVLPIVDNAVTKKVTAAILRSYTEGNSVLLTGNQTVAGIKTFTSQLASSVATGTAPFSVASTTKVTNLNADLLDGLSSADFALSTRTLTAGTGLTGGGDLTANRTFAIDSTVATLTGTQTLTNKTITSPVINEILDSNGNEILGFTPIASATDYITIKNGIGVGVPVHISAIGSSTSIGLHIEPKGSGLVQITDGTDTTKGIRFRSSGSAASAVTLIDAVSSAGRVITLPNATGTLALTSDLTAYVPTTRTVSTTSPLAGGGALSGDLTLSIPQATTSVNGYLSSTDWTTFNNKQNALTNPITGTGTTSYLPKFTGASALGNSLLQEGTSAIGLGVTPLAWNASFKALQIGTKTALWDTGGATQLSYNAYNDGATKYLTTGVAMRYFMTDSGHTWSTAPSGTAGGALTFTSAMTLDASGNLGLGITPSAWSGFKALEIGAVGNSLWSAGSNDIRLNTNYVFDVSGKYAGTGFATQYQQTIGQHRWFTAPSGTAGNAITFTQAMTLDANGQLLIGTTTSSTFKLDVVGTARVSSDATINGLTVGRGAGSIATNTAVGASALNVNTTGSLNTAIGINALLSNTTGGSNTAVGRSALSSVTTASNNTAVGVNALQTNTAANNTAFGYEAALSNITAVGITAIGYQALRLSTGANNTALGGTALTANTTGTSNTAIGFQSLLSNTTGLENTAIGLNSLVFNVSGNYNTAIGRGSLQGNTIGNNNTAVGFTALLANTASNNTAVGHEAAKANTTGTGITAIGYQSLVANTTGANNTGLGNSALIANTTGNQNTAIGVSALAANTTGGLNTAVGLSSLSGNTTGQYNTAVGYNTQSGNFSSSVILGRDATATANNQFVVGSVAYPAGAVATEVVISDATWSVRINGVAYKILLKA